MDVLQILNSIGYTDLRDIGNDFQTKPLYRDSDNPTALCVSKKTGQWYDFVTKDGGSIAKLVKITLGLPSTSAARDFLGEDCPLLTKEHSVELKGVKKFDKELLLKLRKDHTYWINRRIKESTIEVFEGGTTFNGRMNYRYVFPIFDERDSLVGFSGRQLKDNPDFHKWKHIGSKSNWLYPLKWNYDYISASKQVILIESIGDMLALWEADIRNTLVTFGIDISAKVVQFLLKMDIEKTFIAFNNDENNNSVGNEAAIDGYNYLCKFFDPSQIRIAIPDGKDFGEMSLEQINLWKQKYLLPK